MLRNLSLALRKQKKARDDRTTAGRIPKSSLHPEVIRALPLKVINPPRRPATSSSSHSTGRSEMKRRRVETPEARAGSSREKESHPQNISHPPEKKAKPTPASKQTGSRSAGLGTSARSPPADSRTEEPLPPRTPRNTRAKKRNSEDNFAEAAASPYHIEPVTVHEDVKDFSALENSTSTFEASTSRLEGNSHSEVSSFDAVTPKVSLCRDNIAALAESRASLCELEKALIEKKYEYEIALLKMKMENERLKEEALRKKCLNETQEEEALRKKCLNEKLKEESLRKKCLNEKLNEDVLREIFLYYRQKRKCLE